MNKQEFAKALALAKEDAKVPIKTDISIFMGFGLKDFKPVSVTVAQVAKLINYQALMSSGAYDIAALNDVGFHGEKRFIIID